MVQKLNEQKNKLIEILLNAISHGVGVIVGIVFLVLMILKGIENGSIPMITTYSVYGGTFIFLFLMSTLYHSIPFPKVKQILRIFDHSAIYIFIAGSYTPIIYFVLDGYKRILFLAIVWILALAGTIFKICTYKNYDKYKKLSVLLYIGMGWLSVLLLRPMIMNAPWQFMFWIAAGGLFYTGGTWFYKNKNLKYSHFIWHIFVLGAAICHFTAIYKYLC